MTNHNEGEEHMTDETTTETTEEQTTDPQAVDEAQETTDAPEADESTKAGREAAKYRHRAKEAEAERDALAARVETMQRAEAERLAGEHLSKPAGLWAGGAHLADLLDDAGDLDPEKVKAAATIARDELGLAAPRPANHVPGEGRNPSVRGNRAEEGMAAVIRG